MHLLSLLLSSFLFASEPQNYSELLGYSVAGRAIYGEVLGSGSEHILYVGGVHGNEWVGAPLLFSLRQFLLRNPSLLEGKTVVLIPMLNPDGWVDDTRSNRRRVDLNRNFPSDNYGRGLTGDHPLSEPETRLFKDVLDRFQPKRIVSIHQPFSCVDYDGSGVRDLAQQMAQISRLKLQKLGSRSGSLGAYAKDRYPIITMELPYDEQYKSTDKLWKRYGDALTLALIYPETFADIELAEDRNTE